MRTCKSSILGRLTRQGWAAAAMLASVAPLSAQATTVFGTSNFNGAGSNHTFSNGLVSVNFDYDLANEMNGNVERIDGGTFFDQVRSGPRGRSTTFSFNQLLTSFSGLWDLSYRSDGSFETGNSDGLRIRAYNGNANVFNGCLVGSNNPGVQNCVHVASGDETVLYGITGVSFDRVVVSLYSGSTEAYSLSNLNVTTAVPEPRTHLLLLAGLGAIGFIARRRKND